MSLTTTDKGGVITVTGTTGVAESIFTDRRRIRNIYWYRPLTAGHLLNMLTANNREFISFYCDVGDRSQNIFMGGQPIEGMKINDMDSGTVKIYYQEPTGI